MSTVVKDLGAVSAYAYAVEKGYTGTEEEFAELMASYATVGQTAVDAKDTAVAAKTAAETAATTATNKASEATTAAQTATTKAGEASQSASTATSAKDTAVSASQTATSKATEATTAATSANTAKVDAVAAKTAAETAQDKAETAQGAAEDAAESVSASAAQIAQNTSDITDLKNQKAPVILETASGSIASFTDGSDMPMKSLVAKIEPVQDLHGQDAPYPAGGGKNKFAIGDAVGILASTGASYGLTTTLDATNETVHITGTPTWSNTEDTTGFRIISCRSGSYYGDAPATHDYTGMVGKPFVVNKSSNITDVTEIAINNDGTLSVVLAKTNNAAVDITLRIAIEASGSTITAWSPYSNICPISGWTGVTVNRTGKNLIAPKYSGRTNNGITYTINDDGTVTAVGTATGTSWAAGNLNSNPALMTRIHAGTYQLTGGISENERVYLGGRYVDGTTFNASSDTGNGATYIFEKDAYVYPQILINNGITVNRTYNIQLELGSTATDYEPYSGNTYTVDWQSTAGTVYGGTLDVISGLLTVDRAMVDLGTLSWTMNASGQFYALLSPYGVGDSSGASLISSNYLGGNAYGGSGDKVICVYGSSHNVWVKDSSYTDAATFKTAMDGVQLVYELAEPITYQLTPTEVQSLLGINHVWADTGDVNLIYCADTKTYLSPVMDDYSAALRALGVIE